MEVATQYEDVEDEFEDEMGGGFDDEKDEEIRLIVKDFLSKNNIEANTDLTEKMVRGIFKLLVLHRHYPLMGIKDDLREFLMLRLSVGRGSRREQVEILKNNVELNKEKDAKAPGF